MNCMNQKTTSLSIDRIEEFAETILGQGGVKDNLVVRPLESGGYEIISGHRRKAAVQYLLDHGENISRYLPCLVQDYSDDDTRMLDLILMNISSRQISDAELWKSYEILTKVLQNKKESGEKFGRVRDKLAELLGVSSSQVRKLENVKKNAVPEVVEAVKSGELSISTADEIARMDDLEQEELMQQDLSSIRHKDIKKRNDEKAVIYDTKSESDEKAVIYDTKSELDEKTVIYDTKSEPDEKAVIYDTKSEPDEKAVIYDTKSEPDEKTVIYDTKSEPDEKTVIYDTKSVTDTLFPIYSGTLF